MITRIVVSLLAVSGLLAADTLFLRGGNRIEGSFLGGDGRSVRFLVAGQVNTYYIPDVESIRFTNNQPGNASNGYPAPNYPPAPPPPNDAYAAAPNAPPAPNNNAGIEVPSGTQIVVRLIDAVNSERDNLGQTYRASVDQPVVVNGQTVIPRGADAVATLIDWQKSGKIEGRTVLTLDLKTITVNGRTYDIVTTGVPEASGSRGERSAKVIGGTAALGAIIGAIAGGGKGAAIGAGAGAGAGTAAEIATSGQKVKVPAETRLTFTLQNALDF
ncbi:MAG: hypothetical protein JO051_08115 [Acidobacteriaceae bacterium]|nr:hypothetical protein [Acidobacteriaceae bacterium]